jgi:hypothetical protein
LTVGKATAHYFVSSNKPARLLLLLTLEKAMNTNIGYVHAAGEPVPASPGTNALQQSLMSNGFAVIRDVLTPEQVRDLRKIVTRFFRSNGQYKYGGKFQLHALYVLDDVARYLTSDKILARLREITQPIDTILTGECDLMINTTSSWHTDVLHHPGSRDGSLFAEENFRVYKIAFYLQDQDDSSPATLKVRPGSHMKASPDDIPEHKVAIRAGDAIIFDVRIAHAGQMPSVLDKTIRRFFEKFGPLIRVDAQKGFTSTRAFIRSISRKQPRIGVFMTFGPSEPRTYSYAEEGQHLHPSVRGTLSPDVMAQLAANKVGAPLIGSGPSLH